MPAVGKAPDQFGVQIKALMVDVDGVLINGRPDDGRHWAASLEADLDVRYADFQREFFEMHWSDIVVGRVGLMERLPAVLYRIASHLDPEKFVAYWFAHDSRLNHDLIRDLARVRAAGTPVYLATNQERMRAEYLMETVGLSQYVDDIYYSAQLGVKKPDRQFFDKVAARVPVAANELLLIDDALENIHGARAAGWSFIHWGNEDRSGIRAWKAVIGTLERLRPSSRLT
jgi:putative hydrolase of the HAD superfamily